MELLTLVTARNLLLWLGAWSLVGFILMWEDRDLAVMQRQMRHNERISERTLQEMALVGGFTGIILAAKVFHHKTLKISFWGPAVIAVFIWGILFAAILRYPVPTFSFP